MHVQYNAFAPVDKGGKEFYGIELSRFCDEHNLSRFAAYKVAHRGQTNHKGWVFKLMRHQHSEDPERKKLMNCKQKIGIGIEAKLSRMIQFKYTLGTSKVTFSHMKLFITGVASPFEQFCTNSLLLFL